MFDDLLRAAPALTEERLTPRGGDQFLIDAALWAVAAVLVRGELVAHPHSPAHGPPHRSQRGPAGA
ncbi:hypothetical protein, partial [Streptomyces sp. NPDC006285]|uniref:hypothetical protein n=1 Tax=Streptomyces sp. NPDC006285 TaxID=3364742 RepID=UPI0036C72421